MVVAREESVLGGVQEVQESRKPIVVVTISYKWSESLEQKHSNRVKLFFHSLGLVEASNSSLCFLELANRFHMLLIELHPVNLMKKALPVAGQSLVS